MEENTVELFDYFRVIWKRKILIIVVVLVCAGVGVGVGNLKLKPKLPVSYHAQTVLKIGKKVTMSSTDANLILIRKLEQLVETIPLMYAEKINKSSRYHLDVKQIGSSDMIKLILKGTDAGAERVLKELVDLLINEHRKNAKASTFEYENFIKNQEEEAKMIQKHITIIETSIRKMKEKEEKFLKHIGRVPTDTISEKEVKEGKNLGDLTVIWNMLYLKTIDKEIELSESRRELRNIQWQLLVHRTTIGNLNDYNTRLVGDIENTVVKPKKKSTKHVIVLAVVAGLMISLFIAFFMEYVDESRSKRKRK
jgi:capsular polysaccharide biosynthesis protein